MLRTLALATTFLAILLLLYSARGPVRPRIVEPQQIDETSLFPPPAPLKRERPDRDDLDETTKTILQVRQAIGSVLEGTSLGEDGDDLDGPFWQEFSQLMDNGPPPAGTNRDSAVSSQAVQRSSLMMDLDHITRQLQQQALRLDGEGNAQRAAARRTWASELTRIVEEMRNEH